MTVADVVRRPSRFSYVDVYFASPRDEVPQISVSFMCGPTHPLTPRGRFAGPMSLAVTPELNTGDGPFGAALLARVETALSKLGKVRTGEWQERENGWVAWIDNAPVTPSYDAKTWRRAVELSAKGLLP